MNRQKLILLVLSGLLVAAIVYAYFRTPQQRTVGKLKFAPGTPVEAPKAIAPRTDGRKLHLELLDNRPFRFAGYKRNIFWLPLETKKKLPLPPPPPFRPPLSPPLPPPTRFQAPQVQTDMARFTFLGFLKKDGRKTIFLAKDNQIFLVRKGDKILNAYEVTNITDDVLTINSTSGGGQVIIPLVEKKPLSVRGE